MQFYRCRCSKSTCWTSTGVAACATCRYCGSDLAQGPELHSEPAPHDYVTRYDQFTGRPYERCQRCMETRAEIESPPEPELQPPARTEADDYYDAVKNIVKQFPHCDPCVLHRPESCEYCDLPKNKPLHEYRARQGINYTGESDPAKKQCPAEVRRSLDTVNRWPGNRAK